MSRPLSPSARSDGSRSVCTTNHSEIGESELDEDDIEDEEHAESEAWVEPETPPGTPPPEQIRKDESVAYVDRLFRRAKLRLFCPPRWTKVFLSAAAQFEKRLDEKREQLYMAVAQDDIELLLNVKKQVSEDLFNWWGYDCDLVTRASHRYRPEVLKLLPLLTGQAYPGLKEVSTVRAAMEVVPPEGSARCIADMQRGSLLLKGLRKSFEDFSEINIDQPGGIADIVNDRACGAWQNNVAETCIGINFSTAHGAFARWRAIHFVAANPFAVETAVPALELLFKANADAAAVDGAGCTALHLAAMRGHVNVIEVLLNNGAPLDAEDLQGCSAINTAARCREFPVIRALASWMVPEDKLPGLFHTEAERLAAHYSLKNGHHLHVAVARGNFEHVQNLLSLEPPDTANVNYADAMGRRSVHLAAGFISDEYVACDMLKILVGRKADINARDANCETPLHVAARLGRAIVVKTLIRLHAHPNMQDFGKRTPLMLSAVGPDEERAPPAYNGVVTNKPVSWNTIQNVLDWNGRGEPPIMDGPEPRKVRDKGADRVRALLGQQQGHEALAPPKNESQRKRTMSQEEEAEDDLDDGGDEAEDEDEDSDHGEDEKGYFTVSDVILARCKAVCELGFDDQHIIDKEGRVNRGDRIQLFQYMFMRDRKFEPTYPGQQAPLVPDDVRCRFVWKHLTGPLLQLEGQGVLPPRCSEMLSYLLRVLLGKKGPTFGMLVSQGFGGRTMPLWGQIEDVIKKPTLIQRREAFVKMGFVGAKPKLQKWVGCGWNLGEYPRHPIHAPWGAFDFVDKDDAEFKPTVLLQKHTKYNVKPPSDEQAFKDNSFSVFEDFTQGSVAEAGRRVPNRVDQLCLMNRMYLNETAGVRKQVESRARFVGEMLLCPCIEEILTEIETNGFAEENKDRKDILEYLEVAMEHPKDCYVYVNQPLRPFKDLWEDIEEHAIKVFCKKPDKLILSLGPTEEGGRVHHEGAARKLRGVGVLAKLMGQLSHDAGHGSHALVKKARHDQTEAHGADLCHTLVHHECAMPHENMEILTKGAPPANYQQFALLTDDDKRWLLRGESTRAFIELKRCSCIRTCEEFSELICSIAVGGLQDFHGRFWRAAFGLLLWGRAKLLKDAFDAEISRHLHKGKGYDYELQGPFLKQRSEVLQLCAPAVEAKKRIALLSSEPPWLPKKKAAVGLGAEVAEERPPLDYNAGKPGGGVQMPTGIALYHGFTDILHAKVVCDDAKAMTKAYKDLTGHSHEGGPKRKSGAAAARAAATQSAQTMFMSVNGKDGKTKFSVLKAVNSFREDQQKVIPLCAGVTLTGVVGWTPLGYGPPIEQIFEIELVLKVTATARWLANYMNIKPSMMPRTRNEDEDWAPTGRLKVKNLK